MRTETDFLGKKPIPHDALYGIHSVRATENFPDDTPFHLEWYKALGITKLACYQTYRNFRQAALQKFEHNALPLAFFPLPLIDALIESATEVAEGWHFEHFIVPAVQGGAGTSINLNINEIIANRALQKTGRQPGTYHHIDPIEHANVFQSTNDVVPTALKVAAIRLLTVLEDEINRLRLDIEQKEREHRNHLRIGYTQMQEAVPTSFGKLFSTYNEALSRDWWRVSKCFERIKVVNLGGSAVGTALAVPRYFVMEVVSQLQRITRLPVARSENLPDATSNLDTLVEVHAILKAHAVNLEKMSNDLRLLASDLLQNNEIELPQKQVGSSIMPGKVNPVIVEFVVSAAHKIYANDQLISTLSAQGCLELNAYLPVIGQALLESIKLLIAANQTLRNNLIAGMKVLDNKAKAKLQQSPSISTALVPLIGYHNAAALAQLMRKENLSITEANERLQLIDKKRLEKFIQPQFLLKTGFSLNDLKPQE